MEKDIRTMDMKEFYPIYLAAHKHPATKLMHFLGQVMTIGYVALVIWASLNIHWIALGYLWHTTEIVYIPAWWSHKHIEKNIPLGKTAKWKSKLADWMMLRDVLLFRIPLDGR